MSKTIGIIGLGSMGMRHAKNIRKLGHHVWGHDPDMSKRLELGYDFTASKIEHMESADAFIIASPTSCHQRHMCECATARKPFFVEKPIADTPNAGLLYDYLTQMPCMVGYNLRFHSCVKKAKEWITDFGPSWIGTPLWAHFTCAQRSSKPDYLRDGVILNWSHEIDLALYLLGPAEVAASSTLVESGNDILSDILLTHSNSGCRTMIHLDYMTEPERRGFTIVGTLGRIAVNLVQRTARLRKGNDKVAFHGTDSFDENYIEEMQAFIDRIDGKETLGCIGKEALKVLEICLEVRKQAGL